MSTFSESIHRRLVVLETGGIEVHTETKVWAQDGTDRKEIASTQAVAVLLPGDDLTDQPPDVCAVAAAVWTPDQVAERTASLLLQIHEQQSAVDTLRRQFDDERRALEKGVADLKARIELETSQLEPARQALLAARNELHEEQLVLVARSEQVSSERAVIAQQRSLLRTHKPQLAALIEQMEDEQRAADRRGP